MPIVSCIWLVEIYGPHGDSQWKAQKHPKVSQDIPSILILQIYWRNLKKMWTYHDQLSPSTEYYKVQGESLSAILDEVQSSSCDSTSFFSAFDLNVSNVSAEAGCVSQCRLEALDNLPISSRCCHVKAMKLELTGFEFGNHVGCWTLDSLWDFLFPANRFRQLSPSIYMPLVGNWYPKRERMSSCYCTGQLGEHTFTESSDASAILPFMI